VDWYGPSTLVNKAAAAGSKSLAQLPALLPTRHSVLRPRVDRWFESQGLRPRIVGEFEDSALLAVFAAKGVFPVSRYGAAGVALMRGLRLLGQCDGVFMEIHAIRSRRGQHQPLVMQVVASARALPRAIG